MRSARGKADKHTNSRWWENGKPNWRHDKPRQVPPFPFPTLSSKGSENTLFPHCVPNSKDGLTNLHLANVLRKGAMYRRQERLLYARRFARQGWTRTCPSSVLSGTAFRDCGTASGRKKEKHQGRSYCSVVLDCVGLPQSQHHSPVSRSEGCTRLTGYLK